MEVHALLELYYFVGDQSLVCRELFHSLKLFLPLKINHCLLEVNQADCEPGHDE